VRPACGHRCGVHLQVDVALAGPAFRLRVARFGGTGQAGNAVVHPQVSCR
jgi:hypothetical protein